MSRPFKPGDRVRVYHAPHEWTGTVSTISYPDGRIGIQLDHQPDHQSTFYPKQCRRLKPKKKNTSPKYSRKEFHERFNCALMKRLHVTEQYGRHMLVNEQDEILFRLDALIDENKK